MEKDTLPIRTDRPREILSSYVISWILHVHYSLVLRLKLDKKSDLLAEIRNSLIGLDVCIMVDTVSYSYNTSHYSLNMEALYAQHEIHFLHMVQYIFIISLHVQWNTHFNTNTDIPLHTVCGLPYPLIMKDMGLLWCSLNITINSSWGRYQFNSWLAVRGKVYV